MIVKIVTKTLWVWRQRLDELNGDQGHAQVTDLGEHAMQRRLIGQFTAQARRPIVQFVHIKVVKPSRPRLVCMAQAGHTESVASRTSP